MMYEGYMKLIIDVSVRKQRLFGITERREVYGKTDKRIL